MISKNKEQIPKKTFSQNEEGEKIKVLRALSDKEEGFQVTNEIFRLANYEQQEYSDFAILYRTNAQSRILEKPSVNGIFLIKFTAANLSTNGKKSRICWLISG